MLIFYNHLYYDIYVLDFLTLVNMIFRKEKKGYKRYIYLGKIKLFSYTKKSKLSKENRQKIEVIFSQINNMSSEINQLSDKINKISATVAENKQSLSQTFSQTINEHTNKLQGEITQLNQRITQIVSDIKPLNQEITFLKNWQTDFYKNMPIKFPIILTENERMVLIKHINNSPKYLEFGSGGSTFLALLNSKSEIFSVESDQNWVDYIRSWKVIQHAETNEKIHFHIINIGKTKQWGYPVDDALKENYPDYSYNIFDKLKNNEFNTIFVDGRFRVACALASALHYPKADILIHDYTIREYYHIVEKFMNVQEVADTLVVLKLKEDCDFEQLQKTYDEYKYIPL